MSELPQLIATDLDGTLVRSDNSVSSHTHDVLKRLSSLGVTLVGVTGRGPRLLPLCRSDIPAAEYLVMANGSFIYQNLPEGGTEQLRAILMPGNHAFDIVSRIEAEVGQLTVIVENDAENDAPLVGDVVDDWPFPVPMQAMDRRLALSGDIVKTFIRRDSLAPLDLLATAKRLIPSSEAELTEPNTGFVEVCPAGVDKAAGIEFVCSRLGLRSSQTLVFGDAMNDLPLFAWAGHSVAMANAIESVKEVSNEVIASNDADGVAAYLENLYLI